MDEKLRKWFGDAYDEEAQTLTVRLGPGAKIAGEDVDEAVLSEPTLGHLEAAAKKPIGFERDRTLLALIVPGATPGLFSTMPATEYTKAMAFVGFFTAGALPTGESE